MVMPTDGFSWAKRMGHMAGRGVWATGLGHAHTPHGRVTRMGHMAGSHVCATWPGHAYGPHGRVTRMGHMAGCTLRLTTRLLASQGQKVSGDLCCHSGVLSAAIAVW